MTEREEMIELFLNSDFVETFRTMDPEEAAAKMRRAYELFSNHPDQFPEMPPEFVQSIGDLTARFEEANRECNIAIAKQIASEAARDALQAQYDALTDAILATPDPKDTIH